MPTISTFYGISIIMNLLDKEHNPPHIHAHYGDKVATFYITNGELMAGNFPNNGIKLVKEFIMKYQSILLEMWETGNYKKLPPIE